MPLKRSIILQSIFAFCIICLIFIARQANEASSVSGITKECAEETCEVPVVPPPPPPPIPLESENEVVLVPDEIVGPVPEDDGVPFTIVTAASANHFCALESMLYTFRELKKDVSPNDFPRLVVYNLGINDNQQLIIDNLLKEQYFDELINFNYAAYPPFWNVQILRGQYAWKPGIVKEAQGKYGGVIVWLDTGDVPNALFIKMIPQYIRRYGFWSPRSTGLIGSKFNHIGMFKYFGLQRKDFEMYENCNGAAVGFDANNQHVVDELIDPWYQCALEEKCIAPPSSSRQNHRQDQSAITLLATRAGYRCFEYPEFHGLTIHQDEFCHQRLMVLENNGLLLHPSSIDI